MSADTKSSRGYTVLQAASTLVRGDIIAREGGDMCVLLVVHVSLSAVVIVYARNGYIDYEYVAGDVVTSDHRKVKIEVL